jgi:membrane-associated phospholipid phosphatase
MPARDWIAELDGIDRAVYAGVARTPTPSLDRGMRRLSAAADRSRLNVLCATALALTGGHKGRHAARVGLTSVLVSSGVVNALVKPLASRRRPDRPGAAVPEERHVPMPRSRSLPSGHSASAFAFATGVGGTMPRTGAALRLLAAAVGYSRVHTGVHYPGDVVAGALIGATLAQATARAIDRS